MADGRGDTLDDLLWRADHPGLDPETGRPWWEVSEREEKRNVSQSDLEKSGLEVARLAMGLAWWAYLACKHPDEWPGGTYIYEGEVLDAYHKLYMAVITMEADRRHMRYAAEREAEEAAKNAHAKEQEKEERYKRLARQAGAHWHDEDDEESVKGVNSAAGDAGTGGNGGADEKQGGEDDDEHKQRCKYCGA